LAISITWPGLLGLEGRVVECGEIERGELFALVEVHEVGGGEEELRAQALHSIVLTFH
jgi:hypothetical protein